MVACPLCVSLTLSGFATTPTPPWGDQDTPTPKLSRVEILGPRLSLFEMVGVCWFCWPFDLHCVGGSGSVVFVRVVRVLVDERGLYEGSYR